MDFNDVVIVYVKGNNYRIYFWYASKDDAISIMKNSDLTKKNDYIYLSRYKEKWLSFIKEIEKDY